MARQKMKWLVLLDCIAIPILLVCAAGCGGSEKDLPFGNKLASPDPALSPAGPTGGLGNLLPAPSSLFGHLGARRQASYVEADLTKQGPEYGASLPYANITDNTSSITFSSIWVPGDPITNLPYATYQFTVPGYDRNSQVRLNFDATALPAPEDVYIALAQWEGDRWFWFSNPDASGTELKFSLAGFAPYIDIGGAMLAVVAVTNSNSSKLEWIRLGAGPLAADVQVDHDRPLTGQEVIFDALGSTDPDGSIVMYEWDFDGDAAWDASGSTATASHTYGTQYAYNARVRVTDNYGASDTATVQLAATHGPWTMSGHDTLHSRRSPQVGAQTNALKWFFPTGDKVQSSPAVGEDGTVYVGSNDNRLHAINPDGSPKWSFDAGDDVRSSPAIGPDGTVYVGSSYIKLYAINPDGSFKWAYPTAEIFASSPAIGADGTVYIGCNDNRLYSINPDGSLKWSYLTSGWVYSSPAIGADGTVYVASTDGKLHAVNPDGSPRWSYQAGVGVYSSPAIGADETVYVGSNNLRLYAINPDGSLKWFYPTGDAVISSPAIGADGTVYVGCRDNKLYAINPDGSFKWSFTTGNPVDSSPAIGADGTVYVGSRDNKLYAINPDGSVKWSYTTANPVNSSPAIGADGTVYFGSDDFKLYAIGP